MSEPLPTQPSEERDTDAPLIAVVGMVGSLLVVILIVALQALYYRTEQAEFVRKVVSEQPLELRDLQAKQLDLLNHPRWVDRNAGVVAVPIDRAMELVLRDGAGPPAGARGASP